MIEIAFKSWAPFAAQANKAELRRWLKTVAEESEKAFKRMHKFPPVSRTNQYPAVRTGRLRASIRTEIKGNGVTIGSNMPYSPYLRYGTSTMRRRKMSDSALETGINAAKRRASKWVGWSHHIGKL